MKPESYWVGRPLSEFSKVELIEIIETLAKQHHSATKEHMRQLRVLSGDSRGG